MYEMFAKEIIRLSVAHFETRLFRIERFLERVAERKLGRLLGWMTNPFDRNSINKYVEPDTRPIKPQDKD